MSIEKYSEGWRDKEIWEGKSKVTQLIREYLPGPELPEGLISSMSLLAVGFLYCEGKVSEKAATMVDAVYWNEGFRKWASRKTIMEEQAVIQRSNQVLIKLLYYILEFAVINQQFYRNGLKMKTILSKCQKVEAHPIIVSMIHSEMDHPYLSGLIPLIFGNKLALSIEDLEARMRD